MKTEIAKNIYSVGVLDWNMRSFHGHTYSTSRGTTYNSYLIIDDKVTLVDGVLGSFSGELINNISEIVSPEKIDYIIVNHLEADHTGALPEVIKICPNARIFCSQKCKEGLYKHYYENWNFNVVKTGDILKLGEKTLSFIEAPMIHWPDSMFTYCRQDALLMPNDAFGQHYATSQRFDDQVDQCELMDEAVKYYSNILWPLSAIISKKIEEIEKMDIPIKTIAPSHGIVWRRDPAKIINAYKKWSKNESEPKVVIIYETMWGSTEKMARAISQGLMDSGVKVKIFDVAVSDRTEMTKEMMESRGYLFGSSTHDNDMLPTMAGFMEFVKGLKPKNRLVSVFGSYGWAGGAVKEIEGVIKETGLNINQPSLSIQYVPDNKALKDCYNFGVNFSKLVKF
ncbi:MAG: MBL fold metallo-hydrolase [Candidatus Omnitrophota bacterium]|jgi:flavorubredoxin|nr:MAG: MBL fold metallo-hydrolase [Candidatus Omnitrophota bacterium]